MGFVVHGHLAMELVNWTHATVPARPWAGIPWFGHGGSFSDQIRAPVTKLMLRLKTVRALFSGQRKKKQEPSLQINFSTQFGWRHQLYRRVEVKGRELERVGGIFTTDPRTGVWFGPGIDTTLFFNPCMGCSGCCHGNCQLSWCWWVCRVAC